MPKLTDIQVSWCVGQVRAVSNDPSPTTTGGSGRTRLLAWCGAKLEDRTGKRDFNAEMRSLSD